MKPYLVILSALPLAYPATTAHAYGPMTHMLEGQRYLELAAVEGGEAQGAAQIIATGDNPLYFRLGTMYPDIREVVDFSFSTHEKALGEALIAASAGGPTWTQAFARGYLQHLHSDTAAQVFMTPWVTIDNGLGEADLMDDLYTDHPGGETELYVEGGIDLYFGDVSALYDVVDYFVFDRQGVERFMDVFDFYYGVACELHPSSCGGQSQAAQTLQSLVEGLHSLRFLLREPLIQWVVDRAADQSLGQLLSRWVPFAGVGWDSAEMARLEDEPLFADPTYLQVYFDRFQDLGPTMAIQWQYSAWSSFWPVWHPGTLKNSAIMSLASLNSDSFRVTGDIGVYDTSMVSNGAALASLSSTSPPGEVEAVAWVFPLTDHQGTVSLRVRAETGGAYEDDPLCATGDTTTLPSGAAALGASGVVQLSLSFDPRTCLDGANALYIEVVEGTSSGLASYTASWNALSGTPDRDLSQPVYLSLYAPPSARPGYVEVAP